MNQVNMAVADTRIPTNGNTTSTKDVKDDKDTFKSFLEERYETKDDPGKISDEKESAGPASDSKLAGVVNEPALLFWQTGQLLPEDVKLMVMPEETGKAGQPVQMLASAEEGGFLGAVAVNVENVAQLQPEMKTEDGGASESGMTEGIVMPEEMKLADTKEAVEFKMPTERQTEEENGFLVDAEADTGEIFNPGNRVQNAEQVVAEQSVQTDIRHVNTVQEHKVTEHIHVSKTEEIPQKLAEELMIKTSKGVKEFEIQLEPGNLGKIAIKVMQEAGKTIVSILCSEKSTLELIGHNAREIGYMMEQNLGDSTTIYVDKQETDYLHQNGEGQDHTGREAEQERQREENRKSQTDDSQQFIQKLRLGLAV